MAENGEKWWIKLIILGIFIAIVAVTAKVDWAAENSSVGMAFRIIWLFGILLTLGIILPIVFMHLAGNKTIQGEDSDKKWFITAIVLFLIANGIPIIFYMVLEQNPGFLLYLQLALFGLIPAFVLQPENPKIRYLILVILFAVILAPLAVLVNIQIGAMWLGGDTFLYYLFFWGLFCVFLYLIIAIGWKFGGWSRRQAWNIFMAGMLVEFSTLEDFFYFLLNGQALPGTWPWMNNFVINLEALFGHVPTDLDLLIFCVICITIALLILFDVHGYVWDNYIKKK